MSRCGRAAAALVLVGTGWIINGCSDSAGPWMARPFDPSIDQSVTAAPGYPWPYEPQSIRIHPLTRRVDPSGGEPMPSASATSDRATDMEVRIECLDRDGLGTRAIGAVWLELRFNDQSWSVGPLDLGDPELNRRIFEVVTRTYRIGVTLPSGVSPTPGESIRIRATLRVPDGGTLQDSTELPWR